jgi:Protein of unknown function (DUF3095)
MNDAWHTSLPVLDDFSQVTDPSQYIGLPDDWYIGLSDVVNSTAAIESGHYKAVNLAGAGTISAVSNALGGDLHLFIFGGDGARLAIPPEHVQRASDALSRVAMWAKRDLNLELRIATVSVAEVRAAGFDIRAAYWQASDHVRHSMFMGGGFEWAEAQLKNGSIGLAPADLNQEPDLTGLSCLWGSVPARKGKILTLIVKPAPGAPQAEFSRIISRIITLLEDAADLNPLPSEGPPVRWPASEIGLQSRISWQHRPMWLRRLRVLVTAGWVWLIFKLDLHIAGFNPAQYRSEMAANTDFRKFDDSLMMTVDCEPDVIVELRNILNAAAAEGTVRFGLRTQDEALITCVVPSVHTADHMHFVDGADGGYSAAAAQLR